MTSYSSTKYVGLGRVKGGATQKQAPTLGNPKGKRKGKGFARTTIGCHMAKLFYHHNYVFKLREREKVKAQSKKVQNIEDGGPRTRTNDSPWHRQSTY